MINLDGYAKIEPCWVAFYLHKDILINSDSFGADCRLNKVVKLLGKPRT